MSVPIEEAAKCPKCGKTGFVTGTNPQIDDDGTHWDVVTYRCDTELCIWYGTGWVVSSDKRGYVYERPMGERGMDKTFETMSPDALARGRRFAEDALRREID